MSKVVPIHPSLAAPQVAADDEPVAPGAAVSSSDIQRIVQKAVEERAATIRREVKAHGVGAAILTGATTFIGYFGAGPFGALVGALAGVWVAYDAEPVLPSLGGATAADVGHERWTLNGVPTETDELRRRGREAGRTSAVQWLLQRRPDLESLNMALAAELQENEPEKRTPYHQAFAEEVRVVCVRERDRLAASGRESSAAAIAQERAARAAAEARVLAEREREDGP